MDLPDEFYSKDNGPGILKRDSDEVFSQGYSRIRDGTGFGLALVSSIAGGYG